MRKLAWFAGGFCAAALLFALGLPMKVSLICCGALAAAAMLLLLCCRKTGRTILLCLGLAAGLGWSAADWRLQVLPLERYDGMEAVFTAEAVGYSGTTEFGTSTDVRLTLGARDVKAVLYGGEEIQLRPGDRVCGTMRLQMNGVRWGEERVFYGARGYDLRASLRGAPAFERAGGMELRYWPAAFAHALKGQLARLLPAEESGYAAALISGDRSGLSEVFYSQLGQSGTRHVVAVSGMHIGILMGAILLLLGNRRRLAAMLGLPLIWFFSFAVGMTPSVVRSAVMQTFLLLAPILHRENDPPTSTLTALMLILLPNPRAILDVGLQLSFASVAGILLFSDWIYRRLLDMQWCAGIKRLRFPGAVLRTAAAGAAAAVSVIPLTMPLSLLYFGMFSMAAPLSSILIVPVIPYCFSLGLLTALLGMLWPPLGAAVAWLLRWLVDYCMAMTRWIAALPFASVSSGNGYMLIFLTGFYAAVLFLTAEKRRCRLRVSAGCAAGLFCICLVLSAYEYDRADLSVTMLDVGQGQCVLVTSRGCSALYDCGGEGDPAQTAAQFLQGMGRRTLDFLAVSHYDEDHAGGVPQLLRSVAVKTLYLPPEPDERGMQAEILRAAEERGCSVCYVTEDLAVSFGSASAMLYAPVAPGAGNDASVAAHWRCGEFDVLLTGDMDASAEKKLIYRHGLSDIEVLVAGHHGAETSTGTAALNLTEPEIVLISVGDGNSYGHPAAGTLQRLKACGAAVYRTDQCGTITVRR